jgi:hypothetical protein
MSFSSRDDPYKYGEEEMKTDTDTTYPIPLEEWNRMQTPTGRGEQNPNAVLYEMFKRIVSEYRTKRQLLRAMISYVKIESIRINSDITLNIDENEGSIVILCYYINTLDRNRLSAIKIVISITSLIYLYTIYL